MISKQTRTFTDVFCLSLDWRVSHEASLSGPTNCWEVKTEPGV